ncbi:uncharacterized protein LOC123712094 isoform X1 [Pieris brassicae]|uniref:uncharacterized protein LOC123712094 isoform X1 n=1 Tax=Pieris brassicae TaxID=7116 RepID=UPI001E65FB58|nr:uncharacterized protein LOC123712094 isoform X1 [Pieris brassicae]XP_045520994.1 uncharacterized protein LOC123712094 isoform X1 [Pieris brassicae]XP_045520995.1 uncharacterized protein LOC123712094 isoform X1 [Pieris brassicae]XP_045520996.1 uncharacterized protein LOC123712094 isoform X1 [Pieris brassicae]
MARAGMLHRGKNGPEGCDDVQRSLELLDQVLSEYDDSPRSLEARAPAPTPPTPATPADDDSPLAGHTSEDDGYMSMNGRRAKFALGFRPTEEREEPSPPDPTSPHSPPPPEEAERIISNLLPKVSPANSAKRTISIERRDEDKLDSIISVNGITTATQTTFPKTRHQRPYGWEKDTESNHTHFNQSPPFKFSSLQHGTRPPQEGVIPWLPPRQVPVKSPSFENPPIFPFMGFSSEFNDKPYNEHPVTIYPGPNIYKSPTYKLSPSIKIEKKRDSRSDEEILSPKGKIPPRTLAGSMERHREVCRGSSEDMEKRVERNDEEHFSDDSLESFPPPPTTNTPSKRNSIAWEVSLDGDDPLLTPGSTKVIGRRRRRSGDQSHSSTSSIPQKLEDDWAEEYWPPPPPQSQCESQASPSDAEPELRRTHDLSCGTYVIRKGKNRKQLPSFAKSPKATDPPNLIKSHSLNRSTDKSIDGSSISISGSGSVGSYNSRPSSDLSLPQSRYSVDLNSRLSRELNTPNSRYSIDLCTPNSRISKEVTSPKSRLSLDLNGQDKYMNQDYYAHSPKSRKTPEKREPKVQNKLSPQNRFTDFKKYSSTFDNIQSLIKEGKVEEAPQNECNETVGELSTVPPNMVRVISLPTLGAESESNSASRQALITTVEEEEDQEIAERNSSGETSPLRKIENNISAILSQGRDHFTPYLPKDWNIHKDEYCDEVSKDILENSFRYSSRERQKRHDIQKSSSHNEIQNQRSIERRDRSSGRRSNSMHKSTSAKDVPVSLMRQPSSSDSAVSSGGDFPLNVQIVEHPYRHNQLPPSPNLGHDRGPLPQTPESPKFPPLPPSPVQEVDDEYTEIMQPTERRHTKKADTLPTPTLESRRRPSEPPAVPPHRDNTNSLKTRSMETSYNKNRRNSSQHFKSGSTDRRTLPTDTGASGARRRTLQRQNRDLSSGRGQLQTSASLPETPVFARGCDVPRTPPRNSTGPPRNNTMSSMQTIGSSVTLGGYGRGSVMGTSGVCTGADLLRMGGPPRGWYPRQRHRPASIEHLDRISSSKMAADHPIVWDNAGARKPLTLPPNLTPKFFQKSPREALRRVTSLLIRKGNNGKEKENTKNKEATSPAARSANGEEHPGQKQRKGFFRNLWKKSRHYSLEHP